MNNKKCCKVGAYGTGIAALCCFGALGILLGLFGATAALAYVNQYGDFIFFPAYGAFSTLFVYGMLAQKKNYLTYLITTVVAVVAIYFSLSISGLLLILSGIAAGLISIKVLGGFKK